MRKKQEQDHEVLRLCNLLPLPQLVEDKSLWAVAETLLHSERQE